VVQSLTDLHTFSYIQVVSLVVVVNEFIMTVPEEIHSIWRRKWNLSSIIFFASRYLPFVDRSLLAFLVVLAGAASYYLNSSLQVVSCKRNY